MSTASMKGITLLVAVILTSVILSVALALLDIAYKQQLLASTAKQSQFAFYAADTVMECALYWDQQSNAFDFTSPLPSSNIICNALQPVTGSFSNNVNGSFRVTTFSIPCTGSGSPTDIRGTVTIVKSNGGAFCSSTSYSCLYATGYSTCDATDPRRIERGLKVFY